MLSEHLFLFSRRTCGLIRSLASLISVVVTVPIVIEVDLILELSEYPIDHAHALLIERDHDRRLSILILQVNVNRLLLTQARLLRSYQRVEEVAVVVLANQVEDGGLL
jgi:hypothetical protein